MRGGPGVTLHRGDCLEWLRTLGDASVDAVVTDPPAGIGFLGKQWDGARGGRDAWVGWLAERLAECLRVARPGARMLCWSIPRTSHWTATAIEDSGWTIEDRIAHIFGQGFPKAKSKLKPAVEDWWLARKPSERVTPLNIDACRVPIVGPVDPVRESYNVPGSGKAGYSGGFTGTPSGASVPHPDSPRHDARGRWPANLAFSHLPGCREVGTRRVKGSHPVGTPRDGLETVAAWECAGGCPVAMLDGQAGPLRPGGMKAGTERKGDGGYRGRFGKVATAVDCPGDPGCASRFFYCAKASRKDRGPDNRHPTVKSTSLMSWLIRLVAGRGDLILDPFAGSGTTGVAAVQLGMDFLGCEIDETYHAIAERRIGEALASLEAA